MNIGEHTFFLIGVLGFLGHIPRSGITGSNGIPYLGNSILFSIMAAQVCIPTSGVLGFPFLHILASTCHLWIC